MYKQEDLAKYDYFKNIDLEYVNDSLTEVISRPYILGFAKHLIEKKTPFSMTIIDIDNFKLINDNYGHMAGDICLKELGKALVKCVGDEGLVGRFGGDEFVIIGFGPTDYDSVYQFLSRIVISDDKALRKTYKLDSVSTYVTGTMGCAVYPKDSDNYDDLFSKVDKALYRGKTKGRNCFIVYVHEKHKDIDVHRRDVTTLPVLFETVSGMFTKSKTKDEIIKSVVDYINDTLQLAQTFVVTVKDSKIISSSKNHPYYYDKEYVDMITKVVGDKKILVTSNLFEVKRDYPLANEYLTAKKVQSIIVAKIDVEKYFYGYIVLYENKIVRMWQENDVALIMFVENLLATLFVLRENKK